MRSGLQYLSFFVLIPLFAPSVYAEPIIQAQLSSSEIRSNETTSYEIQVSWPRDEAEYKIALPIINLDKLRIIQQGESQESFRQNNQNWIRKTFSFELKPTDIGPGGVDAFEIHYTIPETESTGSHYVPAHEIQIKKAPMNPFITGGIALSALFAFLAAGFFFWRRSLRSKASTHSATQKEDSILEKLEAIPLSSEIQERLEALSEMDATFMQYLSERYRFDTKKTTGEELVHRLSDMSVNETEIQDVHKIMKILHNGKYTGETFDRSDLRELKYEITRFIRGKRVIGEPIAN